MKGKIKVEQVNFDGEIVYDYDTSISVSQIYNRLKKYFPNVTKNEEGMICGEYLGHKYAVRAKNITYLGNPHPDYKKRIQIPEDLQEFYRRAYNCNRTPILLGVYTYNDNYLFCDFNIEDFVGKKAHNSSAHVYTGDMALAVQDGIFQKVDYFNNRITVFRPEYVETFLDDLLCPKDYSEGIVKTRSDSRKRIEAYATAQMPSEIIDQIFTFFENEPKEWHGIECYKKMINDNYRNKYQPEWAGFYLEYEFEMYLKRNSLNNLITYAQDKKAGGIDLDLYFPTIGAYGDLKAHSNHSRGIQGNDWNTVHSIINSDGLNNHIYYIVCEHSTDKDSEHDYMVTHFWNQVQNKENLMSYSKRMKNKVKLRKVYILDINSKNEQYLSRFKQGVNSNGKLREPKIMIDMDNLSHFVLAEMEL